MCYYHQERDPKEAQLLFMTYSMRPTCNYQEETTEVYIVIYMLSNVIMTDQGVNNVYMKVVMFILSVFTPRFDV